MSTSVSCSKTSPSTPYRIATPNHWHTLQTIWACQAGKDVYVEKPCSHNIFESQQIVAAARKYNRIVQQGSQSRSSPALQEGVEASEVGRVRRGLHVPRALLQVARRDRQVPRRPDGSRREVRADLRIDVERTNVRHAYLSKVDYDLWLGPAPKRAFNRNRFHYNWHWYWDTGNGDLGNQGIHEVDIARWGLGVTHPTKVSAIGGKFMFDDDQETPNTLSASFEFDVAGKKKMMTFEVRHWMSPHEAGINGEKPGQHDRQSVLRLEGLPRHRQLQQVLLVHGEGPDPRADREQGRRTLRQFHRRRSKPQAAGL